MVKSVPSLLALVNFLVLGCGSSEPEIVEMEVMPYQAPCEAFTSTSCLQVVQVGHDTAAGSFWGGIEGFEFEWGYWTRLTVEKHPIKDPPMDGLSIRYVSKGTVKRMAVPDWEFRSQLRDREGWTLAGDTLLIDGFRPIRLPSQEDLGILHAAPEKGWLEFKVKQGADGMLHGHSFTTVR